MEIRKYLIKKAGELCIWLRKHGKYFGEQREYISICFTKKCALNKISENRWKAEGWKCEKCIRSTIVEKTKKIDWLRKERDQITISQLKLDYLCGRVGIQFRNEILEVRGSFSFQWINFYLSFKSERHWVYKKLAQI